jgi:hypothetical protein
MKGLAMQQESNMVALTDRAVERMNGAMVRVAVGVMALLPAGAFAQTTTSAPGWGTAVTNTGELFDDLQVAGLILCTLVGVIAFITCGFLIWKKSKPEHARDVQMSHIIWAAVAGTFFMSISLIILNSVETIGGSSSNIGSRTVYNGSNTN